jgi:hypothetical protein
MQWANPESLGDLGLRFWVTKEYIPAEDQWNTEEMREG